MGEKRAEKRIRDKRGFSLAELLVALLITSLAGLIVMGGIGVTTRLFQDVLLHSQAQLVMKEYMSELRSGLLCAEMDSPVEVVTFNDSTHVSFDATIDPVFAHSGYKCAGYYRLLDGTLQSVSGEQKPYGVIVFQPALYTGVVSGEGKVETLKEAPEGETMPDPIRLISSHLSDDFLASIAYYYTDKDGAGQTTDGHFVLSLTVRSKGVLSTGEHVILSEDALEITPTAITPTVAAAPAVG